jgi:hypothetical protein
MSSDGKFIDGFVGISRDASISKELRTVAERVAGLVRRWNDGVYKNHLSHAKKTRDEAAVAFETLRSVHGACSFRSSTMTFVDRIIELDCERGGDMSLTLEVDAKDPMQVVHYKFGGASEATCPVR